MTPAAALTHFFIVTLLFLLFFWCVRIPIMTDKDYSRERYERAQHPVWDAFYQSAMTQSTVGASDLSPLSLRAQVLDAFQALSTFVSVAVVAFIYAAHEAT